MKRKNLFYLIKIILSSILFLFLFFKIFNPFLNLYADSKRDPTYKFSKDFLGVIIDNNYPPYIFIDSEGNLNGYLVDLWKLWEKKTGIRVFIKGYDWAEALKRFKNGEGDILDTVFFNEERAKYFAYGYPYEYIDVPIFYHKNIYGIIDIKSLRGFSIAVKEGDNVINILQKEGIDTFLFYPSYEDIIKDAKNGNIKVFSIDAPPAEFYLIKYNIFNEFRKGPILYKGAFHRVARKGNEKLVSFVDEGFKNIDLNDINKLKRKWFNIEYSIDLRIFRVIIFSIFGVSFIIIFLLIINIILRKEVDNKTKELKNLYHELKLEKESIESILKSIPDIIVIIDKEFKIIKKNTPYKIQNSAQIDYDIIINKILDEKDIKDSFILIFNGNVDFIEKIKSYFIGEKYLFFKVRIFPYLYQVEDEYFSGFEIKNNKDLNKKKIDNENLLKYKEFKTKISSIIIYISDITESKLIEDNLVKTQKFQMIGTLAGGIAHDFNNILHSIGGVTSLLKLNLEENIYNNSYENLKNDLIENLDLLEKSIKKGSFIVSQILEIARERKIENSPVDLNVLMKNSIDIIETSIDRRVSIKYEKYFDKAIVLGNPVKIEQAFINILMNAVDSMTYMKKDEKIGGNIYVNIKKRKDGKREDYVISIKDEGVGIPEKIRDKIFDPFFTTKTDGKGTGLGLAIVYKIVQEHGGWIDLYSKEGEGTTFYLYFPVYNENLGSFSFEKSSEEKLVKGTGKILIVDDDENIIETTEKVLSLCGYEVISAKNGKEGYEKYLHYKDSISLLIIDFIMPIISGIELIKMIKNDNKDAKIIFMTGYLEDEKLEELKDLKLKYSDLKFINKPFNFVQLSEIINNMITHN